MSDLISRKAVIEAIDRERKKRHSFDTFEDGILEARRIVNTLSSDLSAEDPWIPIGKRLPRPYINVLVSYDTGYDGCVDIGYIMNNGNWRMRDNCKLVSGTSVDAWMPLPQEYIWLSDADKKKETECQT